jgi:hypothetical protein
MLSYFNITFREQDLFPSSSITEEIDPTENKLLPSCFMTRHPKCCIAKLEGMHNVQNKVNLVIFQICSLKKLKNTNTGHNNNNISLI